MRNKRRLAGSRAGSIAICAALAVLLGGPALTQSEDIDFSGQPLDFGDPPLATPLSAIDWLSATVAPAAMNANANSFGGSTIANAPPPFGEAPVSGGIAPPQAISTTVLGGTRSVDVAALNGIGLLPASQTGLPRALWGQTRSADVAASIAGLEIDAIPALQSLAQTVLLAEADAPIPSPNAAPAQVLMARIDKLLAMGALDQAYALIEAAGPATNPDLFRRAFDVSLLAGDEDRACAQMRATRGLAIAAQTRIFCAARAGDWSGANLTLRAEAALGGIDAGAAELLARFLDPAPFGDAPMPPPPKPLTPLIWRIYDALGETLPTGTLPLAFAHAELSPRAGWKAQSEAAERLARAAVLSPNQLLGIFTANRPAASGGIWDRIAAFQTFEAAYTERDFAAIANSLPAAYSAMKAAETEVPFSALFAEGLAEMMAQGADFGAASEIAYELGLLSPSYERLSRAPHAGGAAISPRHALLAGLASGEVSAADATSALGRAVAGGFGNPELPADLAALVQSGAVGMATLAAISRIQAGVYGEERALTEGLALLRALGLESAARRTALELMILERRG